VINWIISFTVGDKLTYFNNNLREKEEKRGEKKRNNKGRFLLVIDSAMS